MTTTQYHITRVTDKGEVYGHERKHCDPGGCASSGAEDFLGVDQQSQIGDVVEIDFGVETETE